MLSKSTHQSEPTELARIQSAARPPPADSPEPEISRNVAAVVSQTETLVRTSGDEPGCYRDLGAIIDLSAKMHDPREAIRCLIHDLNISVFSEAEGFCQFFSVVSQAYWPCDPGTLSVCPLPDGSRSCSSLAVGASPSYESMTHLGVQSVAREMLQ